MRIYKLLGLILSVVLVSATSTSAADKLSVLLVDGQNNHKWEITSPILIDILESTGRFQVDRATSPPKGEDMSAFRPNFADYDVVVSNYNGTLWSEQTRKDFVAYVKNGGGFVSVHAANNSFPEWPEYNQIIGLGGWGGRSEASGPYIRFREGKVVRDESPGRGGSHGSRHEFVVTTFDEDHPIMKGLPSKWMHCEDELYDRLRGPARNLNVLATAYSDPETRGSGEVEPMLMTLEYGDGRVFHTVLGHDTVALSSVGFQVTLQRGTEWAATGKVSMTDVPKNFPSESKCETRSFE
ncbi:ThuA domain-containing protein [Rubinisphaera margarita]|uniref:ThuA domain-containing protein n=1 Tax=Rubinisphaera margarita TaxID=2909586 RepID=UPI001EE8C1CC|nr:ThuA domain-containing protein [Rubinisphaera margarita]MCG6157029.1 ThuA domain-containing protein [Rubinisphaera margarita]